MWRWKAASRDSEQSENSKEGWKGRWGPLGKGLEVNFRYVDFIGRQGEVLSRNRILEKSAGDVRREQWSLQTHSEGTKL